MRKQIFNNKTKINDRSFNCYLIKHNQLTPLYFICGSNEDIAYKYIKIIDFDDFKAYDIHYKYNFILNPVQIDSTISFVDEYYDTIDSIFPEILDFSNTDSLNVYLHTGVPGWTNDIRLNEAGNDLKCENKEFIKICKVPKSHFNDNKNGYYFIHHKSAVNGYMTHYETFGVFLSGNSSKASIYSLVLLLGLILF